MHVGLSTYRCAWVHSGAHLALAGLLPLCHQFSAKSEDSRSGRSMEQDKQGKLPAQVLGLGLRTVRSGPVLRSPLRHKLC